MSNPYLSFIPRSVVLGIPLGMIGVFNEVFFPPRLCFRIVVPWILLLPSSGLFCNAGYCKMLVYYVHAGRCPYALKHAFCYSLQPVGCHLRLECLVFLRQLLLGFLGLIPSQASFLVLLLPGFWSFSAWWPSISLPTWCFYHGNLQTEPQGSWCTCNPVKRKYWFLNNEARLAVLSVVYIVISGPFICLFSCLSKFHSSYLCPYQLISRFNGSSARFMTHWFPQARLILYVNSAISAERTELQWDCSFRVFININDEVTNIGGLFHCVLAEDASRTMGTACPSTTMMGNQSLRSIHLRFRTK